MNKLAFEIGVADGIEKTAVSMSLADEVFMKRLGAVSASGDKPAAVYSNAVKKLNRFRKTLGKWSDGKMNRRAIQNTRSVS